MLEMKDLYQHRLKRYVAAMHSEKPDMVPIRPFVAEFTAKYAGYTCEQVTHDYRLVFEAVCIPAAADMPTLISSRVLRSIGSDSA